MVEMEASGTFQGIRWKNNNKAYYIIKKCFIPESKHSHKIEMN